MKLVIDIPEEYYKTIMETKREIVPVGWVSIRKGISYQQRPHGEWKAFNFHIIYCNNCGMNIDIMKCKFLDLLKFCPNCGADMRRKEGEAE